MTLSSSPKLKYFMVKVCSNKIYLLNVPTDVTYNFPSSGNISVHNDDTSSDSPPSYSQVTNKSRVTHLQGRYRIDRKVGLTIMWKAD